MSNIIFVEQYDNRIKILSDYYSEPYTAEWNRTRKDVPPVKIGLGSREYILKTELDTNYSLDIKENDVIVSSYEFYSGSLSIKEYIDQIIRMYNIDLDETQKEYRDIIKKTESADWIDIFGFIVSLYKKANDQRKYEMFLLLDGLIDRYNYNVEYNNGKFITLSAFDNTVSFDRPIQKILLCSMTDNKQHFVNNSYIDESFRTKTLQDVLYKVYLYQNNRVVSQLFYFEPDNETKKLIRNNKIYIEEKKKESIENNLSDPSVYVDLTEEEKGYYQTEQLVYPKNVFVKIPEAYGDYPNIKFVFEEKKCLDFIKASPLEYFLVVNEIDVLYSPSANRRIKIDPKKTSMLVNIRDYGIRNEEYFYYIEDENGTIISDIHILRRDDRVIEVYKDYFLKKKEIQMLAFKKETSTTLQAVKTNEETIAIIKKMIDKIQNDDELDKLDLFSAETIFLPNQYDMIADILYILSINQTLQSDYDKDICNTLEYTPKERKIALYSKKEDTLFSIMQVGSKNSYKYEETYISGTQGTSIDFRIDLNTKACIIRAIDLTTGKVSGFVLIEYPNKTAKYYAKEYLIELKEVE